nr:hypothetical protein [Clostridia bacterium]
CLENAHPNGFSDFKKVIDRLHDEGMLVGLQTYSFFLVNYSTYITPVPHKDLDTLMEFTLAEDTDATCDTITVNESTDRLSAEDTYICVNSPYLWIDDEIVKFTSSDGNTIHIEERGAYNTVPAAHKKGARVRQLKQYFRIPCAKAGSELFYEIARNTAEFCNKCGADMFYLDALDGSFILDGEDYVWYHAMDFLREMYNHLDHDLIFDCCYNPQYTGSWFVRSRYGAIDTPQNSHRRCVDAHVNYNMITAKRMGVTPELGWIDLFTKGSKPENRRQNDTVYPEDLEYHCAKAFATEASLAFLYNFNVHEDMPCAEEYAQILKKYADYRKTASPTEDTVQWLSQPDNAAVLTDSGLYRRKHYVHTFEHSDSQMTFASEFEDSAPEIRIEPLYSAGRYDDPDAVTLCRIDETVPLTTMRIDFDTPISSNGKHGIGVWCYGDGSDTLICMNLRNFESNKQKSSEHFIRTDFEGWRYFAFYEHQNGTLPTELWERRELEYSNYNELQKFYGYYRVNFDYDAVSAVDITVKGSGRVYMKDIRFVEHTGIPMTNPTVRIGGTEVTFETELHQDHNLYFDGRVCRVTDAIGNTIALPKWHGNISTSQGDNTATITSESEQYTRAKLTLTVTGAKLQ